MKDSITSELVPLILVFLLGFWCGMQMDKPEAKPLPAQVTPTTLHAVWQPAVEQQEPLSFTF